MTLFATI